MPFLRTVTVAGTVTAMCVAAVVASPDASAAAAPTVGRLSVTSGPTAGGERLTVTGTGFTHVSAVSFGRARGTSLRVTSTRSLSVVVPSHAAGAVDVRVLTAVGSSAKVAADELTFVAPPAVTSLSPTSGSTSGGTRLVINGSGFEAVRSVSFGSPTGTALRIISSTELAVTVPAHGAATTPVRVRTAYGLSPVTTHTFTFVTPGQAPVSDLAVIDTTETSDRLSWQLPSTGSPASLIVRRAAGPTAPATPTDGLTVAGVEPTDTAITDSGLTSGTQYSYAVFAEDASGDVSPAADATTSTTSTPGVAAPVDPMVVPASPDDAGDCVSTPQLVGLGGDAGNVLLVANLTDPDGVAPSQVMKTSLVDYGPDGTSAPQAVLTTSDQGGWSDSIRAPGLAIVRYPMTNLTDGHLYGWRGLSSDDTASSSPSAECRFWVDETSPSTPKVVSSTLSPSKPVGQTVKVVVSATDPTPKTGRASGIDHFEWGLGDESAIHNPIEPTFVGTTAEATIRITPTTWGENFLYVEAFDAAGNSSLLTVPFYTYDPNG